MIFKSRIIYNIVLSWVLKWNIIENIKLEYFIIVMYCLIVNVFKKIINYMLNVYFCIVEGWIW